MTSGIATPFGGEYAATTKVNVTESRGQHTERTGHMQFNHDGSAIAQCSCGQLVTTNEDSATPDIVASHQSVIDAWGIPAGQVMVVRDHVERAALAHTAAENQPVVLSTVLDPEGKEVKILGEEWRGEMMQAFQPWATVLMIGDPYITDYGQTIQPPPVYPGTRVLIVATAAEDVDLEAGGETMRVTLVSFRAIKLWKRESAL